MGMPKKAKGGSKHKTKGGKAKDGKPKERKRPQITVSDALRKWMLYAECLCWRYQIRHA